MNMMSEDAKAILLLCGHLGGESGLEPLNQREYTQVVSWLLGKTLRPSDLLIPEHVSLLALETGLDEARLLALLWRGVQLAFAVERWNQSGIWVVCRSDSDYPQRYKDHLKDKAPPMLFGSGDRGLLKGGGLAIVGSRSIDAEGEVFAREIAACCAREGMPVVSGGARGVDQTAMSSALDEGGIVVGVLADSLLRRSVEREARRALADNRLLLISPYNPEAGFNIGNAMGRNKLIYGLAEFGMVVSAEHNKGGTWAGAIEELKMNQSLPIFIRSGANVPKGNQELIKRGGFVFSRLPENRSLREFFVKSSALSAKAVIPTPLELPLLSTPSTEPIPSPYEPDKTWSYDSMMVSESRTLGHYPKSVLGMSVKIVDVVKPIILQALQTPLSVDKLAKELGVRKIQLQDWLAPLLADGILVEKTKGKAKVIAVRTQDDELSLN